jgi:hypothetical protein
MDKLIKYLKEKLKLSDDLIKVVLENIKIKYVVPTYYYKDWLFTDLNVLDEDETSDPFYNLSEFNENEMSSLITCIIDDKGRSFIPKRGLFGHLKAGEEYWAIYKDAPPINIVVHAIEEKTSWRYYTYTWIRFLNKTNNQFFTVWDESDSNEELYLFSTREEAVSFYKDKFDLN